MFLAFNAKDLTSQIPEQLRQIVVKNALSIPENDLKYQFNLNDAEIQELNSMFSTVGDTIFRLANIPEWIFNDLKLSELMSRQVSDTYNKRLPEILKSAIARAGMNNKLMWNFLLFMSTGTISPISLTIS